MTEAIHQHPAPRPFQPWLHDLILVLAAPTQAWSGADGQMRDEGIQGVLHGERRLVSELVVTVDGEEPVMKAHHDAGGDAHVFVCALQGLGGPGPDPSVRLVRRREIKPGVVREQITLHSTAAEPVECTVRVVVGADLAPVDQIKAGIRRTQVVPDSIAGSEVTWSDGAFRGRLRARGAQPELEGQKVVLTWPVRLAPGASTTHELLVSMSDDRAVVTSPEKRADWGSLTVESSDRRLAPALDRALSDLRLLRLVPVDCPDQEFLAAGAPWFLTLFGRDSLWAARMLLPVTTTLADSTLRLLAARQGARVNASTAEEPGKILHEVRGTRFSLGKSGGAEHSLPPVYYGTIDATPLWALTLHDAWRWGLPEDRVEPLLPSLTRALDWMVDYGDTDGDYLLEYFDETGTGLSNQGWKDSGDAIRAANGSLAKAPLALAEAQGYAYAAALRGADLLEAFGHPGTDRWRVWAEQLGKEFRSRFWVEDAVGPFPAVALDGDKRPVASVASNIGHLLGTGLLAPEEAEAVARRLVAPDMLSGFGIRTLSRDAGGYSATGYHVGSVWPHDTAICLAGMVAERRPEAAPVAEALLSALHMFNGRPPELFGGDAQSEHPVPVPYPAACRPQAWASAAAVSLLTSVMGLSASLPRGSVHVEPIAGWSFGHTRVSGLRAGGRPLTVDVSDQGVATIGW